ncbi:flavin reductase [Streptomyces sp. NPDC054919]
MTQPSTELTSEQYRDLIGRFATGVTVITAANDGTPVGTTASAVSSLSLTPPMLLICMNKQSATGAAIARSGQFAVNVLGEDHPDLAMRFAVKGDDKFAGVCIRDGKTGQPLLADALATFECKVVEEVTGGTHTVFLATVHHAAGGHGAPLAYFRGKFGRLKLDVDDTVLHTLRELLGEGALPHGTPLDIDALADAIEAPRGSTYHALSALVSEGLARRVGGGFEVPTSPAAVVTDSLPAVSALLLGATELTVESVTGPQCKELQRRARDISEHVVGDGEHFVRGLREFARYMVGLSNSAALLDAWRSTDVQALTAVLLGPAAESARHRSTRLLDDLVAAYVDHDHAAAIGAVRDHGLLLAELHRHSDEHPFQAER